MESRGFLYSFIAHLIIVLAMVIQIVFYPSDALDLSQAIRVDMIDLPEKIVSQPLPDEVVNEKSKETPEEIPEKKETKPPPVKAKALPEKKEKPAEDSVNINKVKSKQKEALNKLKAISAIDKLKKEMAEEAKQPAPKQVFKGRVLSAGTALTGLDKLQSDSYLAQIDARIKSSWTLPQWLIGKSLRTRVLIKFDDGGNVIFKRVTQSSGNPTYDEYCLLAIDKASPFPRVPEKFSTVYKIDGVTIGFPD